MTPEIVLGGAVDRVVFAFDVIHCETTREGLLIFRLVGLGGVWFAGLAARFEAGDELDLGQGEQVAQFGRVEEVRGAQFAAVA